MHLLQISAILPAPPCKHCEAWKRPVSWCLRKKKIAAYVKCVEETRIGNKEFTKAKQTLKKEIDAYRKHEEVEWFCVTYLDTFSLTLDELE